MAMSEALDGGKIKTGDRVLLAGFGAGMAFGSMVIDWVAPR